MIYPWYEVVTGGELEQGDLLLGLPVIVPTPEISFPLPEDQLPVIIQGHDVVVMTQSCDLTNDKVADAIVCPHWDLMHAGVQDPALAKKGAAEAIRKGRRHRYLMVAASASPGLELGVRVVDFGRIFSLPKTYLAQFAATKSKRLRLCPPYREHLSQAFARYFMRVGLPQDIDLAE